MNKLTKLGVISLSALALGAMAPALVHADTDPANQPAANTTAETPAPAPKQDQPEAEKPVENTNEKPAAGQPQTQPEAPAPKQENPVAEKQAEKPVDNTSEKTTTEQPQTQPETPAPKQEQPAAPTNKPSDNQQALKYRVTWYLDGKVYHSYESEIEPGETLLRMFYDKGTVPKYETVENTSGAYNITYDGVKAGKTHYEFYLYNRFTHNPDGSPKKPSEVDQQPLKYRVVYKDIDTDEILGGKDGVITYDETAIERAPEFSGYYPISDGITIPYVAVSSVIVKEKNEGYDYIHQDILRNAVVYMYYTKDKPEETQQPLKYRVVYRERTTKRHLLEYHLSPTDHILGTKENYISPGETILETPPTFPGYKVEVIIPEGKVAIYYSHVAKIAKVSKYYKRLGKTINAERNFSWVIPDSDGVPMTIIEYDKIETPTTPVAPTTPSTARVLSNEAGSVQVHGSTETLKDVSYIKVEEVKADSLASKNYKAFDIHLYDANGKAIQPKGMVTVSLTADQPVENVYYVAPDGSLQALDFKQDKDKVTFETNHFSIYAMSFRTVTASHTNGNGGSTPTVQGLSTNQPTKQDKMDKDKNMNQLPNTGESQSSLGLFGLALAAIGLAGLTYKGRHQG